MNENRKYYIYGAGKNGELLLSIMRMLKIRVEGFIDSDIEKAGIYSGMRCLTVEQAAQEAISDIVLISVYKSEGIEKDLRNRKFENVYDVGYILAKLYYFFPLNMSEGDFKYAAPFNRFDSPYSDISEVRKMERKMFASDEEVEEIDFNIDRQCEILDAFKDFMDLGWDKYAKDGLRYYYDNSYFTLGCAKILYYMIRFLKPKRIIEVGSGFSTAVMLDTNEQCFNNDIDIISIEPYPDRLRKLLRKTDAINIYEKRLEDMPLDFFQCLGENDILFIDSSHVSKFNSDVNFIFFNVLPKLKSGVYIHFHDIFYPFIYPKEWIYEGRAYNEMYLLRAFLMNNEKYSIQLFPDMLIKENIVGGGLSNSVINSIYIRKE